MPSEQYLAEIVLAMLKAWPDDESDADFAARVVRVMSTYDGTCNKCHGSGMLSDNGNPNYMVECPACQEASNAV